MPLVGAIEARHDSIIRGSASLAAEAEHYSGVIPPLQETAQGMPSMELGPLAPPPVMEIHTEGERDGAGAPRAAIQAPADSGPPAATLLA